MPVCRPLFPFSSEKFAMLTVIRGGRVIDPGRLDAIADILIAEDKIVEIFKSDAIESSKPEGGSRIPDTGCQDHRCKRKNCLSGFYRYACSSPGARG
jgi:hypothetical protein